MIRQRWWRWFSLNSNILSIETSWTWCKATATLSLLAQTLSMMSDSSKCKYLINFRVLWLIRYEFKVLYTRIFILRLRELVSIVSLHNVFLNNFKIPYTAPLLLLSIQISDCWKVKRNGKQLLLGTSPLETWNISNHRHINQLQLARTHTALDTILRTRLGRQHCTARTGCKTPMS